MDKTTTRAGTSSYYLTAYPDNLDSVEYHASSSCELIDVALILQRCGIELVFSEYTGDE